MRHVMTTVLLFALLSTCFISPVFADTNTPPTFVVPDGKLTTDFASESDFSFSVLVQDDGKIITAGYASINGDYEFALARYNTNGNLDTSFSGDGKVTTAFPPLQAQAFSATLQADGKILLAGSNQGVFALARYNTDGSLDTSFSDDGMITYPQSLNDSATIQDDGKILIVGYKNGDFALARLNTDGSFDNTFSPPENTLDATPSFTEDYSTSYPSAAVVLAPNVQIFDTELSTFGSYNGASLTLVRHDGANVTDVFSALSDSGLTVLTQGSYFAIDSVSIGRVTSNSGGTLTLTFLSNATQALVSRTMQQIAYRNTSDNPPESVQIDWTFNDGNTGEQGDGDAMSVTGSLTVNITARNDAPIRVSYLSDQSASVNIPFSYTVPDNTFTDPDDGTLTVSIAMVDGTGVPPWLSLDPSTHTLLGTPSVFDIGSLDIRVTASDPSGATASDVFRLSISDADSDVDGINNSIDNCPTITNPDQNDANGNDIGDACDAEEVQCGADPADPNSTCGKSMPWLLLLLGDDL